MAHYAKISNAEFTVTQRQRIQEIDIEISSIKNTNRQTEEYINLKNSYEEPLDTSTLNILKGELLQIQPEGSEEYIAKQAEIDAEYNSLIAEKENILSQMTTLENQGTDALVSEKQTLQTAIDNSIARVTAVFSGADEIYQAPADTSSIDQEIKTLEESRNGKTPEDIFEIDQQIQAKQDEKNAVPKTDVDNTVYWEGQCGGCKRTSYNTQGGVHLLGGTPFRKNYAGVGHIYDPVRDAFYREKPYASWVLNEDTCYWEAPIESPGETFLYWNEATQEWLEHPNKPFTSWIYGNKIPSWNGYFAGDNNIDDWFAPTECPDASELSLEKPVSSYYWNEETLTWINK